MTGLCHCLVHSLPLVNLPPTPVFGATLATKDAAHLRALDLPTDGIISRVFAHISGPAQMIKKSLFHYNCSRTWNGLGKVVGKRWKRLVLSGHANPARTDDTLLE